MRHKDGNWNLPEKLETWDELHAALMMDLRDELKMLNANVASLNRTLHCPNFLSLPQVLRLIAKNTTKPKRKVKVK